MQQVMVHRTYWK